MKYFAAGALLALACPAYARGGPTPASTIPVAESVFDGDYLSVGVGGGYGPSYDGSDDYVLFPGLLVRGSLGGIGISPRSGGIGLDFVKDGDGPVGFDAGIAARIRSNRAGSLKDPVVRSLGKLDRAIEVGPTFGLEVEGLLHEYDGLSLSTDIRWDVAGAHSGMVIDPSISYVTPFSRGIAAQLSVGTQYVDGDFMDYYYSVTPAQSTASGLPVFDASESGFTKAGVSYAMGFDLNGNIEDGGFALVVIGSYYRMLGQAKDSPFTSIRGDADQWLGAMGVAYTF